MTRWIVLLFVAAATLWAVRNWRRGLGAVMVLLVLEGAIRKWLVPGASSYVYFAKDLLLLGVYWGYLSEARRRRSQARIPGELIVLLGLAFFVGVLEVFNPRLPSLLVGILGLKAYFLYVPLLWVVPAAFQDEVGIFRFLRRYLYLAIPIGTLAFLQFVSPSGSRWNTYAPRGGGGDEMMSAITFGAVEKVRVTGTFSFITGYSAYLQVILLLSLSMLTLRGWRLRGSLLVYSALALTFMGLLMTGSRGPVLLLLVTLPIYWVLGVAREGGVPAIGRFLLGLGLIASVVNFIGADAVGAFRARAAGTDDVLSRIIQPFTNPFRIASEVGLFGYGIGSSHQTAEVVTDSLFPYSWLEGHQYEDEPSRVMVELGIVGFLAWYGARLILIGISVRMIFRMRRPLPRALVLSCLLLFLTQLVGGVVFNVTGGLFYWFFCGLLFLALRLNAEVPSVSAAPVRIRGALSPKPAMRAGIAR